MITMCEQERARVKKKSQFWQWAIVAFPFLSVAVVSGILIPIYIYINTLFGCVIRILAKRMLKWNMKWVVEGSCTNIKESFSLWIPRRIHLPQLDLSVSVSLSISHSAWRIHADFHCNAELSKTNRYKLWTKRKTGGMWDKHDPKKNCSQAFQWKCFIYFL